MIDLHSHSTHSDGTKTPDELLNIAKQKNILQSDICKGTLHKNTIVY